MEKQIEMSILTASEEHMEILANLAAIKGKPFAETTSVAFGLRTLMGLTATACLDHDVPSETQAIIRTAFAATLSVTITTLMRAHAIPPSEIDDILAWVDRLHNAVEKHT